MAVALPHDPIDTSGAAIHASAGDTIAYAPSFAFAPLQLSPISDSGIPVDGPNSSFASFAQSRDHERAHGDKEFIPMSGMRIHHQPSHSKRRKLHWQRGSAAAESHSRAFTAAARSSASHGSLHLTLLDDGGIETVFRMGTSASFEQVAVAYAGLVGTQPHRVQFWHSGALIRHSQTPDEV